MTDKTFPHISDDTGFPGDDTHPYAQYPNRFDYQRWTARTTLTVTTVPWQNGSGDEPYFDSPAARDEYFSGLASSSVELDTMIDIVPDGQTRVPIPYDKILSCNYLIADVPALPGSGGDFEHSTTGRKYYYHIVSASRLNATVSAVSLAPDYWTTWQFSLRIPRMDFRRGHAAVAMSANPTDYLSDPLAHSEGLTGAEPDAPADPVRVSTSDFVPFGTGDLLALFAVRATPGQLGSMRRATTGSNWTPPSFSDGGAPRGEWNHQYTVNGYGYGTPRNLDGTTTPWYGMITHDGVRPNNWSVYAIEAAHIAKFLNACDSDYPQFFQMVGACFVVPASFVTLGGVYATIGGVPVRGVAAAPQQDYSLSLSPDDFGYDDKARRFTKMYTWPYACLRIGGNDEDSAVVRVENLTSRAALRTLVCLSYPYINVSRMLVGSGSGLSAAYEWRDLSGTRHTTDMPYSGFRQCLQRYSFPTFELTADNATIYNLSHYSALTGATRGNAVRSYHSSVAGINTGRYNADRSADTANANTIRSADTSVANTARSGATSVANTKRGTAANVANTETSIASTTQQLSRSQSGQETAREINVSQNNASTALANSVTIQTTAADKEATTAQTNLNNTIQGISTASNAVGSALSGNVAGAVGAVVGGVASMVGSNQSAAISNNLASAKAAIQAQQNNNLTSVNNDSQNHLINAQWDVATDNNSTSNSAIRTQASRSAAAANTSASASANTANSNAGASAGTAKTNSAASAGTTKANAGLSQEAGIFGAQNALRNTQDSTRYMWQDMRRGKNTVVAAASGDATPDILGTRPTQVSVVTQPTGVVRRCADDFARHGYTYPCVLEKPDLMPMTRFAYWEGDPTIIGDMPADAVDYIRGQFAQGLTLWHDLSTLKEGSIYDNARRQ